MQRLRAWRYWPWLRDAALVLLVLLAVRAYQHRDAASGAAPELAAVDIHGTPVSLAERAFPTSFVVDGSGVIRHVEVGYTTELGLRARMWLAR